MDLNELADNETIATVSKALKQKGFNAYVVDNSEEARKKVLELIPSGAEVMEASSITLNQIGITKEINESGRYRSLRKEIMAIQDKDMRDAFRKKSSSPDYAIGSVQAVTQNGELVVASASGSQIASYAYGAANLVLVIGTNKIVKDIDQAFKRVREQAFPLENERAKKAYGQESSINKLLIIEKERPNRINVILVKEVLGY